MSKKKKHDYDAPETFYNFKKSDGKHILGIDLSDNPEQRELVRLINENGKPIIFCVGDAGTGKTFTAVASAIELIKVKKKYSKVYYIREPIEVGKSLGFVPGTVEEKFGVYLGGLEDNLYNISQITGLNINDMKACIEPLAPQYIRGRSFPEGSLLLVDEAQNLSLETIQMLSTRIGKYSKIIFLGSLNQIDLKGKTKENNDFKLAYEILTNYLEDSENLIGYVELVKSERSEYCKLLDEAFNKYKEDEYNRKVS